MSAVLYVIGGALLLRLRDKKPKYPHTMYDCNTGQSVEVENKAQHDDYTAGGWVHSFDECPLDTPFGRDYGDYDYEDSVDDMTDVQTRYDNVYQDDADLENVAVYRVMALTYDPQRERRGYYRVKNYVIGSTNLNSQGRPTSFNYKGDSIRTFSSMDDAIAFLKSIGKRRPQPEKQPEGQPMPEPEVLPEGDDEPSTPEPTPAPITPPSNPFTPPMGGYGVSGGNLGVNFSSHGGEY